MVKYLESAIERGEDLQDWCVLYEHETGDKSLRGLSNEEIIAIVVGIYSNWAGAVARAGARAWARASAGARAGTNSWSRAWARARARSEARARARARSGAGASARAWALTSARDSSH